jgi:mRNA interferase HigB
MHIITRKRLNEFAEKHPDSKTSLQYCYRLAKTKDFKSLAELRKTFGSADQVGNLTVFNIGGNKVRLIAAIHYNRHTIYIRAVLTYREYDEGKWKE